MTDMITVSRKEIEDAIDTLYIETFSGEPYIAGTRKILALLDKAEVVSGEASYHGILDNGTVIDVNDTYEQAWINADKALDNAMKGKV